MKSQFFRVARRLALLAVLAAACLPASAQNGTLRFSSASYSAKESAATVKVTVRRTGGSSGEVTVEFATIDSGGGTATPGVDYFPTNGTLTFGPGVTSLSFHVPLVNDAMHEDAETVQVELIGAAASGLTITTITVTDNDACVYALSPASLTLNDLGGLVAPVLVTATAGCEWTAAITSTDAPWLGIFSGFSGVGDGEVVLSVDPNPGSASRTANLRIAGRTFVVTQRGVDSTPPTLSINSPAANSRQTNPEITVTGKAADNLGVVAVEVQVENEGGVTDYVLAEGTANWSAMLTGFLPGQNIIRARAYDATNPPVEVTRTINFVETRPITLATNGEGSISGLRNGQILDVGRTYTTTARAARNHFFTGWSGSMVSGENPLTFAMHPDFLLEANFVPSPFTGIAGTYNGLCNDGEAIRHASSGFITLKLTGLGAYSAKMVLGGKRISFSGRFALDGLATNEIVRADGTNLIVMLSLDLSGFSDQITGTVSDGGWTASILTDRGFFNKTASPAPQAGRYTLIVPGDDSDAANQPGGDSFGTVTIDAGGRVKFSGTLADGTKISQGAPLSKNGWWPFYVPLYGGGGSVLSWVIFAESPESNLTGVLNWIKPPLASANLYANGFAIQREFSGSSYQPPAPGMERVLTFSGGRVRISAGNLADTFDSLVLLGDDNKVTDQSGNSLKLSISLSTGLFSGSVVPPGATRSIPFQGVLHQKQNYGGGFFLGTNQSGKVRLSE